MEITDSIKMNWHGYTITITMSTDDFKDIFNVEIKDGEKAIHQHIRAMPNDDVLESSSPIPMDKHTAPLYGIYNV